MARLGLLHLNFLLLDDFVQYHEPRLFHVFFHLGWPHWVYKLCPASLVTNIISSIYSVRPNLNLKYCVSVVRASMCTSECRCLWSQQRASDPWNWSLLWKVAGALDHAIVFPAIGHSCVTLPLPLITAQICPYQCCWAQAVLTIWLKLKIKKIWHGNAC